MTDQELVDAIVKVAPVVGAVVVTPMVNLIIERWKLTAKTTSQRSKTRRPRAPRRPRATVGEGAP